MENNNVKTNGNANGNSLVLQEVLNSQHTLRRFVEKAGGDEVFARRFLGTLATMVSSDSKLKSCDAQSVLSAASQAVTLKLPLSKTLGYAYVIPYKNKGKMEAQFQIGWKGLVQLAQRSGLYKTINADVVYEGELKEHNRLTGAIDFSGEAVSDKVVGYVAYFELLNGFSKTFYMSKERMEAHAKLYSQAYGYDVYNNRKTSVWSKNFDAMGTKTVLKLLLGKYGPVSVDMERAMQADQAAVNADGTYRYVDNEKPQTVDVETGEVLDTIDGVENIFEDNDNADTTYTTAATVDDEDILNERP